jgi:hypothetical protein
MVEDAREPRHSSLTPLADFFNVTVFDLLERNLVDMPFEAFEVQEGDDADYHNAYLDFMQNNHTFDDTFMERKKEKRKKKQPNLDDFIGDNNGELDTRTD